MAEAIFKKLEKNKKIKAYSRGLVMDKLRPYVEPIVIKIMKKKGYRVGGKPKKLTLKLMQQSDLIVIVASDVNKKLFSRFGGRIIVWKIKDVDALDEEKIRKTINEIEKRVKKLIKKL